MTKKIVATSLLLLVMIILSLMPIHGSLSGVKEEEEQVIEGKRQEQQQFAYATNNTTTSAANSSSSSSSPLLKTTNFNFAAVGDWGCTADTTNTIKNIQNKDPELVLALGDLSYENTGNCWLDETSSINSKLNIAMGNHEHGSEGDPTLLQTQYKKHFGLSNTYYSIDYSNVHFIAIDSMLPYTINSPQYSFVKNDLISTSQNPYIKWIIVYFHHPMYTSATKHPSDLLLRETYHPLFDQYGVDLVLQGHNHNYQRSYPLTYNNNNNNNNNNNYNKISNINNDDISSKPTITSANTPTLTSTNTNTYNNPTGEIYVTAGTGGESLYDFKNKADFIATQYKGYGFFNVDISSDGTKLIGTFYANEGIGSVKDTFTITKSIAPKLIPVKEQFYNEKSEVLNAKIYPDHSNGNTTDRE